MSKILIIDDETDLVMLLKDELEAKGHEVLTAYDGQTGIDLSQKTAGPDHSGYYDARYRWV